MKLSVILLAALLVVSCSKKTETDASNAGNSNPQSTSKVTETPYGQIETQVEQTPSSDTIPEIFSQIESQARGMKLLGKIVFWRGGQLYLMNADGGNQHRIIKIVKNGYGKISWAPDAKRITFAARGKVSIEFPVAGGLNAPVYDIFTTNIDSVNWYTQLTDNFGSSYPDWSRDGKSIWASVDLSANKFNNLFEPSAPNYQLFKATLGSDTFTTKIYYCPSSGKVKEYVLQPALSPDGGKMAFTMAATNEQGIPQVVGLVIVPAGEIKLGFEELLREAQKHPKGYAPSWSPDGKEIAYTTPKSGKSDLYLMSADGGNERLLLASNDSYTINSTAPGWSPDGKWLCFGSMEGSIYIVSKDGKKVLQLTQTDSDMHPAWSPK